MASLMDFTSACSNVDESAEPIDNNKDDDQITCLVMKKSEDKTCYMGKYCPQLHGKNARYNAMLDVYYTSSFDPQTSVSPLPIHDNDDQLLPATTVSIFQSSCSPDNKEILWTSGQKIIGREAEMISFFGKNGSHYQTKSGRPGRNQRQKFKQKKAGKKNLEKLKTHLTKFMPKFKSTTASFKCSEKCIDAEFSSAELFAKHYVQYHEYPLLYYEQPMKIKFIPLKQCDRLTTEKVLHRCVIRFTFEKEKFFLLEYFQLGQQSSAIIYDFTQKNKSTYVYELEALTSNVIQGEKKCFVIGDMHNKDNQVPCSFLPPTKDPEYFLRIRSHDDDIRYDYTNLFLRPGCQICCGNHETVNDCSNKLLIHKNLNKFEDEKKKKLLKEFIQKEKKIKTYRQNNYSWKLIEKDDLELLPIGFITATKSEYNHDAIQKFVRNKISDIDTQEKKLMTMLEEKEKDNKLLEHENEAQKLKIKQLEQSRLGNKRRWEQSYDYNNYKRSTRSNFNNTPFIPVISDPSSSANNNNSSINNQRLWANDLNDFCMRNGWKKNFHVYEDILGTWRCEYTLYKGTEKVVETSTCSKKKDAVHAAAKLLLDKMKTERNLS